MKYRFYFLAVFLLPFVGCGDDDIEIISISSEEQINTYLDNNNIVAEKSASGLYYVIENEGTGQRPRVASRVRVAYKGYLTDGTVFDQSTSASFGLNQVIAGWTEGIQLFKVGGNGLLLVPAELGYGNTGIKDRIPGNAALIFEVELLEVL